MRFALSEMGVVRLALCAFGYIVWQGEGFWEGEAPPQPGGRVYPGSDGASPYRGPRRTRIPWLGRSLALPRAGVDAYTPARTEPRPTEGRGGRAYPGSDGASPYRAAWIQSVSRMVRVSTRLWVATLFRMTIASPSLISTSSGIVTL